MHVPPALHLMVGALAAMSLASQAAAAPCAGFTDVDDTSSFCPTVEWMKNRAVTTGCTSTLYCPNEVVTRLQMSAFLQRLGNALTPVVLAGYNSGSFVDVDTDPLLCQGAAHTPSFPRRAHGLGQVVAWPNGPAASFDLSIRIVESTDNGATWTPVTPAANWSATGNGTQKSATVLLAPRDLLSGTSYRWALQVTRAAGSAANGDIGGWYCQLHVQSDNRIATSSPLDPG